VRARVEEGVEAGVVTPYGLVALWMRQHGHEPRATKVEETMLRLHGKGAVAELDQNRRQPWRSERPVSRRAPVGKRLAAHEAAEHDVVEEMLAREMHRGKSHGRR
jgi:hypothetical protein